MKYKTRKIIGTVFILLILLVLSTMVDSSILQIGLGITGIYLFYRMITIKSGGNKYRRKAYTGWLIYGLLISVLNLSSSWLLVGWLQVMAIWLGADSSETLILAIWIWSLVAMTLLKFLPKPSLKRFRRKPKAIGGRY